MATESKQDLFTQVKERLRQHWDWENGDFVWSQKNINYANMFGNKIGMSPSRFGFLIWSNQHKSPKYSSGDDDSLNGRFAKQLAKVKQYDDYIGSGTFKGNDDNKSAIIGIPFQYIEQIPTWQKSANWSDENVIGRFEPMGIYANSSPQDLSLSLIYYAESSRDALVPENSSTDSTSGNMSSMSGTTKTFRSTAKPYEPPLQFKERNAWSMQAIERFKFQLQSLVFPQYDGTYAPPLTVLLNIGNIFVDVPVIIKAVSVEEQNPFEVTSMRSMLKKINVEMRVMYPQWQALSAVQIWSAPDGSIFARQSFKKPSISTE